MTTKAVIDLGFGDSGKGTFTAYLCSILNNPIVVRFSGGHQAGHNVVHNGVRHVHASFGSGTLQGVPTYWTKNCTFYPSAFLNELDVLMKKGITIPKVYVDAKCPVTTFLDVLHNKKVNDKTKHGSCGVGFGATLEREENHYSLLVEDLKHPTILEIKLKLIAKYYDISFYQDEKEYRYFLKDCKDVLDNIEIVNRDNNPLFMQHAPANDIIYEGSQGLLLDKDIGFFPHVTRGNVGSSLLHYQADVDEVFYITRAYQTRHGNGPMTNQHIRHNISDNPNETNKPNYQGVFRKTLLDVDLLLYSISKDDSDATNTSLVITCLDHVENEWRFTYGGHVINCLNEYDFIDKIVSILSDHLNGEVYVSHSDEFKNIKIWGND